MGRDRGGEERGRAQTDGDYKALNVFYRRHPPSLANGPTGPASPFGSWCLWGVSGTGSSMGAPADLGPGSQLRLRPHPLPASGTPGQALRLPSSCPSPILTVTSRPGVRDLQSSLSRPTQLSPLQRAQLEGPLGEGWVGPLAEQAWRVRWTPPSTLLTPPSRALRLWLGLAFLPSLQANSQCSRPWHLVPHVGGECTQPGPLNPPEGRKEAGNLASQTEPPCPPSPRSRSLSSQSVPLAQS